MIVVVPVVRAQVAKVVEMKIAKSKLKQIIREEYNRINEARHHMDLVDPAHLNVSPEEEELVDPIRKAREDATAGERDEELYVDDVEYHAAHDAEREHIDALGLAERKKFIKRLIRKNVKTSR